MSVAQAGPSARSRARLNRQGSAFLTNYVRTLTAYPARQEKEALLASLRSIPGNEDFTYQKLSSWFARHRQPNTRVPDDDEPILFPKLTPMQLQQLRALYKKRADPSEPIITFWAARLKADRDDVVAWIQYQQAKAQEDATPESPDIPLQQLARDSPSESPTLPRPHLPTPPSISPQTRMPSLPPIAVKLEDHRPPLSPVSPFLARSPTVLAPSLSRLHTRRSNGLLDSLRDSLRPAASEAPPRTADEFSQRFAPVEKMIDAFLTKYDGGQLAALGWDSTLGRAGP